MLLGDGLTAEGSARLRALVVTLRPQQWPKNVLVAAAPLAAGKITDWSVARGTLIAFVAFVLASSAVYCFNDVVDRVADAHHPTKRRRPVAAGELSPTAASVAAAVLGTAAVLIPVVTDTDWLWLVVLVYLASSAAYSQWLKHQPVIELVLVSSGFLLRGIAGGAATGLPLSRWFLIVAGFGSLFMVTGKRLAELLRTQGTDTIARRSIVHYTPSYLRALAAMTAGVTCTAYCLWAFEVGTEHHRYAPTTISVVWFVVAILRYMLDIDLGRAEEPEQFLLRDRVLQVLALLWLITFSVAVLGG